MIEILYTIGGFIVALGILIIVHEFGHYWVAQKLGIRVLRFSVGFGKPIWKRNFGKDKTELVVAAIPLGGYVKMLDETEGEVPEEELDRAFNRQSIIKRMAVVLAGPLFNFIFAVIAFWVVYMFGISGLKPVVGYVKAESPAAIAGFQKGDEIITINNKPVQTWDHRRLYIFYQALAGNVLSYKVRTKDGQLASRTIDFANMDAHRINARLISGYIGLVPNLPVPDAVVGEVMEGPAKQAGLRSEDRILSVDGTNVDNWESMAVLIRSKPGKDVKLKVWRSNEIISLTVRPKPVTINNKKIGLIHIRPMPTKLSAEYTTELKYSALQGLVASMNNTWLMSALTIRMLYKMLLLEVSARNISGPLTIAEYAGKTARFGMKQFLLFLAVISISLGVLNLLPIPILDGGHFMYYLIEAVKGSPVSEAGLRFGQIIGLTILAGLMLLAFYNDLTRIFN